MCWKKVYWGQFTKGRGYSELKAPEYLPNFTLQQFGKPGFIYTTPTQEDIALAKEGLKTCKEILQKGEYDIVVLDEINIALYYKLFECDEVIDMLENRASHVEVILTGRKPHEKLMEKADLITEMKEIKHYYTQGVLARVGIEN